MILAERAARLAAEARIADLDLVQVALEIARLEAARAQAARLALELEIERLKLQIAKLRRQHFGTSAERSARLEQLVLALEDLEESAAQMDGIPPVRTADSRLDGPTILQDWDSQAAAAEAGLRRADFQFHGRSSCSCFCG